ncbi:MAG TPA: TonB-dependent receptor [Cyclobacteriaceae bacterium]|nr:TonB-dependent receptor [Cyclobacteriaceae bacterium]
MKKALFTLLFLPIFLAVNAQNGAITGAVKQSDSLNSLPGVNIWIDNTAIGTVTNGSGNFILRDVPDGNYMLTASSIGYLTIKKNISLAAGETLNLELVMKETISTLEEVVVMTKGFSGLKDIPGSVQYLSPKDIRKFSYTDINRALRAVPGINMQEEDGFGLRPNIGLRGTGVERSSKITIMEDGVLIAPAPYADPAAYYFPTIGRMQAIEILKGNSQIKYGPYTTGGAINLITTQIPENFSGKVDLIGGSFGGKNLHTFAGNTHKHIAYLAETFQYGSDGFKSLDGGGDTGFDKKDYMLKFRVNTGPEAEIYQSLSIKIGQAREVSNETYLGLTETDFHIDPYRRYAASQKDLMKTSHSLFTLTHQARFSDVIEVATTAYRTDFSRNWYKLDKVRDSSGVTNGIADLLEDTSIHNDQAYAILTGSSSIGDHTLFAKANNRTYYGQGIQSVLSLDFNTQNISHYINLGIRLHHDQADRFQWQDEYSMNEGIMMLTNSGIPGTESNRIEYADAMAAYLQYKLKLGNFTATPGIRYENITIGRKDFGKSDPGRTGIDLTGGSNQVDVIIPGIGLDYQFNKYVSTFAGVHKGFSPPGSRDETVPEESVNYEAGVRYTKNSMSGQAILFFNDYSNLLGTDLAASGGGGTGDLFNAGEVQSKGLELQVSYDLLTSRELSAFSLPVSFVYTYTDAVFQTSFISSFEDWGTVTAGDHFPYLANHQFTFLFGMEHRKFSLNLSGRFMDEMRTSPGQGEFHAGMKTDSYFVTDASASYLLHKNIALFANIINLTNEVYVAARRPSGLRPGMPRAVNSGLKVSF